MNLAIQIFAAHLKRHSQYRFDTLAQELAPAKTIRDRPEHLILIRKYLEINAFH